MANARMISFLWLVAQGTAVVISILLAFGIQAWWDETREREEERQILGVLAMDLRDAIEKIEFALRYHEAKKESALRLIEVSQGLADAEPERVERWLCHMHWNWPSEFFSPAFDTLLAGGLSQVENPELRLQLARLEQARRYTQELSRNDSQTKREILLPYFKEQGFINVGCPRPGGAVGVESPEFPLPVARDRGPMLGDPEFAAAVALTYWDQWDGINILPLLRQTIQEVLEAVEGELEGIPGESRASVRPS